MNRISDYGQLKDRIVSWMKSYLEQSGQKAFVVGVSGGIDSAVVSTLCAETGLPVYAVGMSILQKEEQENLSLSHLNWLKTNYNNVIQHQFDLTELFYKFKFDMDSHGFGSNQLALANTRSRLRMVTLYQIAELLRALLQAQVIRLKIMVWDFTLNMVMVELILLLSQISIKLKYGNLESIWA